MIDAYKEEALFIAKRVEDEAHSSSSIKAARTIRMLVTMIEAAQKDQARYQWLKSRNFPEVFPASPTTSKGWVVTSVDTDWEEQLGDGKTPDEAIDAAMAATKGEQA